MFTKTRVVDTIDSPNRTTFGNEEINYEVLNKIHKGEQTINIIMEMANVETGKNAKVKTSV